MSDAARARRGEWAIHAVQPHAARRLIIDHHYSGSCGNSCTAAHGVREVASDVLKGALWWMVPGSPNAARGAWDGDPQAVLHLSRFVLAERVPNLATLALARSVRLLLPDVRWRCLLTYADTYEDHWGGIYRAAGWEYMGETDPKPVWLDPEGRRVTPKSTVNRTRSEMEALGYRLVGYWPRLKFRRLLAPRRAVPAVNQPALWSLPDAA